MESQFEARPGPSPSPRSAAIGALVRSGGGAAAGATAAGAAAGGGAGAAVASTSGRSSISSGGGHRELPSPATFMAGGGAAAGQLHQQQQHHHHAARPSGLLSPPPPELLAVEDMLVSPRVDQASPHFRPFPTPRTPTVAEDAELACADDDLDLDCAERKDQTRRKPRFSTSSLPDIDW